MTVAVCIGMIGMSVSKAGNIPVLEGSASETIVVQISNLLSSFGAFPAIIAGFILAGILAATMSTADSQLLAASSAFSENLLQDVFGIKLSEKQTMLCPPKSSKASMIEAIGALVTASLSLRFTISAVQPCIWAV